ncbi:MAG: penicillin-binding protein 2 [Gammaproteobacteria bacterium]|nr:penicillin-binding protein 2 [Gammaproteobacteria bacterium]MCP4089562.1 penicillin-binding protein 2 [Gammaproteobacteria bacterium]MCP4278103.1 penicillin-binding protein 2 [Gammaproteobacteria bacterium]MCP4832453.1 penicillin-binding protein 2 [Gammaproteobacteria bacterium]MCP4930145.1 penicillin-binding protein 2 [Gammaproteobacteria bacterium]
MESRNQIKDHWHEQRLFTRRIIACAIIAVILTGTVISRLVILQLINADYYAAQSQGNRIRIQPLPPTRGLIYDRNNKILAENTPSYQLEITPEQVPDLEDTLTRLKDADLIKAENMAQVRSLIANKRRFDSIPILQRMSDEDVAHFAVLRPYFPGVEIRARLTRYYPYGNVAAHALGYVSGINSADQESLNPAAYAGTSYIGKVSLERSYEAELLGEVGHQDTLVNVHGRMMQILNTELSVPGQDLILSLDVEAQLAAEDALQGRRGAVVAIDPNNGEILVFASAPSFNPNNFISGLSREDFHALQTNVNQPLFNRALRGKYPPGSTIKPMLALTALEENIIIADKAKICRGYFTLPGRTHRYRDWKPAGHGKTNLHDAIAQSCDTYFYELANDTGIDIISSGLQSFGLGSKTGIDISPEGNGLVPSREWKRKNFSSHEDQIWFPGETIITGIGQGYMLTTPLQLAHATAAIAARGTRYRPSLVKGIRDSVSGGIAIRQTKELPPVKAKPEYWDEIISAMEGVMNDPKGTAHFAAQGAPWRIAGKSGTAQVFSVGQDDSYDAEELAERMRDHALFIAFAPVEEPRIAVAVIVENGGSGSGVAAPIARKVLDVYLTEPELGASL